MVAKYNTYKIEIIDSLYYCIEVNGQGISHFIAPDTKSGIQKWGAPNFSTTYNERLPATCLGCIASFS